MKKFYTLSLAAICAASAFASAPWDGSATAWTEGDGSADAPFIISSPAHLAYLAEQVNAGSTFQGQYFRITDDLDMAADAGRKFPVIGLFDTYMDGETQENVDNSLAFMGTLDGNYHTIDNLAVEYFDEEIGGTGFFAVLRNESTVCNLILGPNSSITGDIVTGAFVGQMLGGTIQNCANYASVTGNMFTGGFVGCMEGGRVSACANHGIVLGTTEVGGIVGQGAYRGAVEYCYNTAAVTATGFGGAGIGGALYDNFTISNCYNVGAISGKSNPYMGSPHAIVSDLMSTNKVTNCLYVSELSGYEDNRATAVTADELRGADALATVNGSTANFVAAPEGLNDGFPVLAWEAEMASVRSVVIDRDAAFTVNGRTITATASADVYDFTGRHIASGSAITLPAGHYIVVLNGRATKLHLR